MARPEQRTSSQLNGGKAAPKALADLAQLAREAGATEIAAAVAALMERLAEGRFYVACVGQFKRGKSTLLNALIGQAVLPTGVVPITTALTVLRYGDRLQARVRLGTEWHAVAPGELATYVSEEHNPANEKGVGAVDVFVRSALLASGMWLVDTPGIGSVVVANTETTRAFVPHIDAALVVIGADPPISADEVALIEQIAQQVRDLIFVLSKADRLTETERREATTFARKVLAQRLGKLARPIFEVSATERLTTGDATHDWQGLEAELTTLATRKGVGLVHQAERRGHQHLTQRLLRAVEEQRDALVRPIDESERRIEGLRACVAEAERALSNLGPLLSAEQQRLSATFRQQWEHFIAQAVPAAREALSTAMQQVDGHRNRVRRLAIHHGQDIAARCTEGWFSTAEPAAEQLYRTAAQRFVDVANDFLARLATSADVLAGLPREVSLDLGFRTASGFYSTELMHLTGRSALRWMMHSLQPPRMARRSIMREVGDYLERLVSTNTARILNDLDDRVLESRRRLEAEIRGYLRDVCTSAERALERARTRQAAGKQAVQAEARRLESIRRRVEGLRTE